MSNYFDASGTIGFTCDNCGRELQGCTWVNGMRFCAKCYQETFGNTTSQYVDMLNKEMYELKIADLEAKLEESKKAIVKLTTTCDEWADKYLELEAKLAESEEAIKYLKGIKRYDIGEILTENTKLKQQLAEKEKESLGYFKEYRAWKSKCELLEQDNIEFALEQLEKVLNLVDGRTYVAQYLKDQIKQLKDNKE